MRGLEVGYFIGVFTAMPANFCRELLAVDVVDEALAQAAKRCVHCTHVVFQRMQIPGTWPIGRFDLIVLSEVLYFLNPADIAHTANLANTSLASGGMLLLVNYTGKIEEPSSGDEAAEGFIQGVSPSSVLVDQVRAKSFRVDLLEKRS